MVGNRSSERKKALAEIFKRMKNHRRERAMDAINDIFDPAVARLKKQILKEVLRASSASPPATNYDPPLTSVPPGLPAPRIQLRWEDLGVTGVSNVCHLEIVFSLDANDFRRKDGSGHATISLLTRSSSGAPWKFDFVEARVPFDALQCARADAAAFGGLPIFVVAPDGSADLLEAGDPCE